ncbi:MAG: hypothetical protein ACOYLF_04760 [Blastocatellia bacterium]|jgi:hypothetical protein
MIKKADEVIESQPMVAVSEVAELEARGEVVSASVEPRTASRNVNLLIQGWLTDVWLLTTGEEILNETSGAKGFSHGRPLAFTSDGQIRLLGSRSTTLDAMRDVGIEMS